MLLNLILEEIFVLKKEPLLWTDPKGESRKTVDIDRMKMVQCCHIFKFTYFIINFH